MKLHHIKPIHWVALLVFSAVVGAGTVSAVPMTMYYQVEDLGGGTYQYDFTLVVDNNDSSYSQGQAWRWLIFGDSATSSPLTGWQIASGQLPVGPWTSTGTTSGGHNGPNFAFVLDYWTPTGIGDVLHWRGTSTADLAQGQMLWSTIAGTLGGGVAANFEVATRVAPGFFVDAIPGTASSVLNTENGGGNGYEAAAFDIINNGTAAGSITDLTIRGEGTGDHTAAYSSFQIYRDETGSGTVGSYDTGDALIGTGTFSGSPAESVVSVPASEQAFAATESKRYFIVVQLNGTAVTASTFQYRVSGLTPGGASTIFNIPSRLMAGLVIDGPAVTATGIAGSSEPVQNNEDGGGNGFEAGTFTLTANSFSSVDVNTLTIRGTGTGSHLTDYSEFSVYRDQTGSGSVGSFDTADALIGTTTFSGSPAETTLTLTGGEETFAANETKTYFVVIKLGGTASVTETFDYVVQAGTASGTAAVLGVPSATINGVNIIQAELTFDGATVDSPGVVPPSVTDHEIQAFVLSASAVAAQDVSSITVSRTGTITDAEISAVKLWEDTNGNGLVDTGEPQVGSTQTFSAGTATFSGSPLATFSTSQSKSYIVTYSLGAAVANGTTLGATLTPTTDVSATPGPVRVTSAVATTTHSVFVVTTFAWSDDLESMTLDSSNPVPLSGGWWNHTNDGPNDWYIDNNGTPSGSTGPSVDHNPGTATGRYMYFEDSNNTTAQPDQRVHTPPFDISALSMPGFSFWVYAVMGSGSPNELHIDLIDAITGDITQDIVSAITTNTNWQEVFIDLSSVTATVVQIQLRLIPTGSGFQHDVAVDDFQLRDLPEINLKNSTNADIPSGGSDNIGGVLTTGQTFTYTIENLGGGNLNLTGTPLINVTPISNVNVNVTAQPASPIAGTSSTTFDLQVLPQGAGGFSFTVSIANDDPNENPYTFTVSGSGVANQPPAVTIPTGSNWVNNAGNYELFVDPGNAYNDDLEVDDPTPDNMTVTVTPPGTAPTTITNQPASIGTPTAGPITLNWAGTADATNPPGGYVWQIAVDDGVNTVNFTATIFINDLAPVHAAGIDANTGDGQASATAYTGTALVGSSTALTLADMTNPNTGQAMTLGNIAPDGGNPAGGSGFTITFVADSIVATPTAALVLADVGTHIFDVEIDDAGNTTNVFIAIDVQTPEIDVERNSTAIADGGADTVTGAMAGQNLVLTYDITNNGTSDLTITTAVTSNLVNCTANVTLSPAGTVTPTSSTTLEITVNAGVGAFSFDIAINNDDVDEDPYDIAVSGNAAAAPEIDVDRAGTPVADGTTDAVGTLNTGVGNDIVYTITNNGTSDLTVTGVTVSGFINCTATVTVQPAGTVTPTSTTTFTVQINPTADGPFSVGISIASDDADENPYDITATGTAQTSVSGGGGGGGGGGGCAGGGGNLPLFALLLLAATAGLAWRTRRA